MRSSGSIPIRSSASICAGAPGEQDRGQHRPQFLEKRQAKDRADRVAGAETIQRVVGLQRHDESDEKTRHHDDDQRPYADVIDLAHGFAGMKERAFHAAQCLQQKHAGVAQPADRTDHPGLRGFAAHSDSPINWVSRSGAG
jgi:hypothetical protein